MCIYFPNATTKNVLAHTCCLRLVGGTIATPFLGYRSAVKRKGTKHQTSKTKHLEPQHTNNAMDNKREIVASGRHISKLLPARDVEKAPPQTKTKQYNTTLKLATSKPPTPYNSQTLNPYRQNPITLKPQPDTTLVHHHHAFHLTNYHPPPPNKP